MRSSAPYVAATVAGALRNNLLELGDSWTLHLPIRAHTEVLGVLSLFLAPDREPDTADELTLAEIASRIAQALDNARLVGAQTQLAEGLQRSLLTDPPEPDHGQIVVRYLPAAEAARVGGDWYDAFVQPAGSTMLVIGDVAGHDTAAAATMGQLRGLLRGIATYSGAGPAEVLRGLDASMEVLLVGQIATAAAVRFEQTPEERKRGTTRMVWSSAGHPAPILVHADGRVEVLGEQGGELLLGWIPRPSVPSARPCWNATPPSCSTPTGWWNAGAPTSTRAPAGWWPSSGPSPPPGQAWTSCATGCCRGWSSTVRTTTWRSSPSGCILRTGRGRRTPVRDRCRSPSLTNRGSSRPTRRVTPPAAVSSVRLDEDVHRAASSRSIGRRPGSPCRPGRDVCMASAGRAVLPCRCPD